MTASASAGVGAAGAAVGAAAGKAGEFLNNLRIKKPEPKEAEENVDDDPNTEIENPEDGEAETDSWLVVLQDGIPCALMLQKDMSEVA